MLFIERNKTMITPQQALNRLLDNNELFYDEMTDLMRQIMMGQVTPEVIAAILIGLRVKVESVSEIAAAATVMREFATKVPLQNRTYLVDIVGTGGDNAHTFNISTTSMFVVAAAGAKVAKHGGRSVSSSSGSADIIEAMGASLELTPEHVGQCISQLGVGFMYAPNHHNSMKYVAPVRRALGVRTIFNILGPLTNPAGASNQVLGVFHIDLVGILSRVLQHMGSSHVLVVHGCDGLDEITLTGATRVAELKNGTIMEYDIHPAQFDMAPIEDLKSLQVSNSEESLKIMNAVLSGEKGPCRDIVVLNSAAAIYAADIVSSLEEGVDAAIAAIDSGNAKNKQKEFIQTTQQLYARQSKA